MRTLDRDRRCVGVYSATMIVHAGKTAVILLVDDNPGDVRLAREVFTEAGLPAEVRSAGDGVEAVTILQRMLSGTADIPALVLVDINMPRMNGFELMAFIKRQPQLAQVPVFILSSSRRDADAARAHDLGAEGYLVKPESFDGYIEIATSLARYLPPP
jgi:CheY-like chemotaxis protein